MDQLGDGDDARTRLGRASAVTHIVVSFGLAVAAASFAGLGAVTAGLIGWVVAGSVFLGWTLVEVAPLDSATTARMATREDPGRAVTDIVLLAVAAGSLVTVVLVIFRAEQSGALLTVLGLAGIVCSWAVVPTVYALRYARMYYGDVPGGLDFHQDDSPSYRDFLYLAFTVSMTFQVSDTEVGNRSIRASVLRQSLISFAYYTVVIAVTINLVAGLGT